MAPRKHRQNQVPDSSMAPVQYAVQHLQPQQYAAVASYEADPNLLVHLTGVVQKSETELNLSVLQRYNPEVCVLEHIAPYGVVYEWVAEHNNWEKSGIEGSVFICKLWPNAESNERYTITVLNRRQLHNLDFELKSEEDVEFTDQYIILMDHLAKDQPKVWGLWIFAEPAPSSTASQPQDVADKIRECLRKTEYSRNSQRAQDMMIASTHQRLSVSPVTSMATQHFNASTHIGQKSAFQDDANKPEISVPVPSSTVSQPMFAHSADTSFFLTPPSRGVPGAPSQMAPEPQTQSPHIASQRDHLLSLFRQVEG